MVGNLAEQVNNLYKSYKNDGGNLSKNTYFQLRPLLISHGFELRQEGKQIVSDSPMFYGAVHVREFQELFIEADIHTLEPGFTYIHGSSFENLNSVLQDRLQAKEEIEKGELARCTKIGTGVGISLSIFYMTFNGFSINTIIPPFIFGLLGNKIGEARQKLLEENVQLKHRSYLRTISKVNYRTGLNALESALG
jgi:hypothetical protein